MNDIPEQEARAILQSRYVCEDYGEWAPAKSLPDAHHLSCGLIDENSSFARMYVELMVKESRKTNIRHYKFSVLRHKPYEARIYQLEIKTSPKSLKDKHQRPHEHIGDARISGDTTWGDWGFHDVLAHFKKRTNIEFRPDLENPMDFRLRPS